MAEIDYAMAWHFKIDGDPRNLQMRFRRNWAAPGSGTVFDGTGQLIAVVIHPGHADNEQTFALSKPDVDFQTVENVIEGWQRWAWVSGPENQRNISLNLIHARLAAAGLA